MNLTLSIDEKLAERAREVARAHGISLNELIRRYLASVAGVSERATLAERYRDFERPRRAPRGPRRWKREDAYEDRG